MWRNCHKGNQVEKNLNRHTFFPRRQFGFLLKKCVSTEDTCNNDIIIFDMKYFLFMYKQSPRCLFWRHHLHSCYYSAYGKIFKGNKNGRSLLNVCDFNSIHFFHLRVCLDLRKMETGSKQMLTWEPVCVIYSIVHT